MIIKEINLPQHEDKRYRKRTARIVRTVIHHTATKLGAKQSEVAHIQAIARGHIRRGWPGIAYHFVIGPSGAIYRCHPTKLHTYHVGSRYNDSSIGVALIGRLHVDDPTAAQLESAAWLCKELGYSIVPHKALVATACPGHWERWGDLIVKPEQGGGDYMRIGVHLPNDGHMNDDDWRLLQESGINLFKALVRLDLPVDR